MRTVNEFLATLPFDLYALHLFRLVVEHRSFTRAAVAAGLTQSAVTRQMQALESSLGLNLIERTTRSVLVTPAGEYLHRESVRLAGDVDALLAGLKERFAGVRKPVRMGVSQTVGLAYLPGFFHANLRRLPEVPCRLSMMPSEDILTALQANELDLGVVSKGGRLPAGVTVTHRFADQFCLIAPSMPGTTPPVILSRREFPGWADRQSWLLISDASNTGRRLRRWFDSNRWKLAPAMELDSFDLIISLVALGMGVSFVPVRALALYGRKRSLRRVRLEPRFERELLVVARHQGRPARPLRDFIDNILF